MVCLIGGTGLLLACTIVDSAEPIDARDDDQVAAAPPDSGELAPSLVNEDSGVFSAGEHPSSSGFIGTQDAGAGTPIRSFCTDALGAGDLAVVEMMIASRSGSGDLGEWVEVQSTRDCWLRLNGVTVTSPRGAAAPNTASVDGLELAPRGTFVVADSLETVNNHGLPGTVYAWNASDVLKNDGDSVVVARGAIEIDRVTYPTFTSLPVGRALAFPVDCARSARADWTRWSLTFSGYAAGLKGTPNAPNADVTCL